MNKMKRKERICRKMSRVCESVAAILIGFGISIDSDEIVPTAMLLMQDAVSYLPYVPSCFRNSLFTTKEKQKEAL